MRRKEGFQLLMNWQIAPPQTVNATTVTATQPLATVPATTPPKPVVMLSVGSHVPGVLRLQVGLSKLGYLPLTWLPPIASGQPGKWVWRYSNIPPTLRSLWQPGVYTVMTEGAVMSFEAANHLAIDGVAGPQVMGALTRDLLDHRLNQLGYAYVHVSERLPETLTIWWNGRQVIQSLTNTGIAASPTQLGTWPVYLRYVSQTMSGVTPSGQAYSDPGVPWVNYFYGGDAVHGFVRHNYGWPQSLGCVELPISTAKQAWTYMQYGTLVTVDSR